MKGPNGPSSPRDPAGSRGVARFEHGAQYRQLELYPSSPPPDRARAVVAAQSSLASINAAKAAASTPFMRGRLDVFWREPVMGRRDSVSDLIDLYQPDSMDPALWVVIEPIAKEWVWRAAASDLRLAPRMLTALTRHLAWCHGQGLDLVAEVVLHVDTIEQCAAEGLVGMAPGSVSTYRSMLRTIGEAVLGPEACPTRQRLISKSDPEQPYSDEEVADLLGAVRGLTTPHRRDNALVIMSCGLGAGLANSDLCGLVGGDVDDSGPVVAINITFGPRQRRVPVRVEWENEIVRRAREVGDLPMFHPGRAKPRVKDIPNFLDRLSFPYLPRLGLQRLRVTWIVRQLEAGVPPHVVAASAGVGHSQISTYFRFLGPVDQIDADRLLRGESRAK